MCMYVFFFLMLFFHSCCGQSSINVPKDNIKSSRNRYSESQLKEAATSKVPISMVRNVKQDRNGNILIAASWGGVFRYDGTSFTNVSSEISPPRFPSSWDGEEISAIKHTIYDLFTKVTFLFTIQISQAEKYQSRFTASILTGYETIMILPKPAG